MQIDFLSDQGFCPFHIGQIFIAFRQKNKTEFYKILPPFRPEIFFRRFYLHFSLLIRSRLLCINDKPPVCRFHLRSKPHGMPETLVKILLGQIPHRERKKPLLRPLGFYPFFFSHSGSPIEKMLINSSNKLSSKSVRFLFLSFPVHAGTSGIHPIVYFIYCSLYSLSPVLSTESRKNPPPAAAAPFSSEIYLLPAVEKRTLFTRPFPVVRFIPVYSFTLNSSICGQQIFSSSGPAGAT